MLEKFTYAGWFLRSILLYKWMFFCIMTIGTLTLIILTQSAAQEHDPSFYLKNSRNQRKQEVSWTKGAFFGFDNPMDITDCPVPEGKWVVRSGKLHAIEGDRNRAILLHRTFGEPFRIEFDVMNVSDDLGRLGDITVLLNSAPGKGFFSSGYSLTTASFWNQVTTFYKKGQPIARAEYSLVESGKEYHVTLEFINGNIRYWLNDKIILEAWDENPLDIKTERWIGLRTWSTDMTVDNVTIYTGTR